MHSSEGARSPGEGSSPGPHASSKSSVSTISSCSSRTPSDERTVPQRTGAARRRRRGRGRGPVRRAPRVPRQPPRRSGYRGRARRRSRTDRRCRHAIGSAHPVGRPIRAARAEAGTKSAPPDSSRQVLGCRLFESLFRVHKGSRETHPLPCGSTDFSAQFHSCEKTFSPQ